MIKNLIKIQLSQGLRKLKKPLNLLGFIFLILAGLGYGYLIGRFLNEAGTGDLEMINPVLAKKYGLFGIMAITLIRMFIPTYKPLKTYFPKYYPLSVHQQYWTSIFMDIINPYFLFQFIFLGSIAFTVKEGGFYVLLIMLSVLYSTHFLRRMVQYILDFKLQWKAYIGMTFMSIILVVLGCFPSLYMDYLLFSAPLVLLLLILTGYLAESTIIGTKHGSFNFDFPISNVYMKIIFKNKPMRSALLMSFIFKIAFTLFYSMDFNYGSSQEKVLVNGFVVFLFIGPIGIGAYGGYNLWGFWPSIWQNFELRLGTYKPLVITAFRILSLPILVDFMISTVLALYVQIDVLNFIGYYFVNLVFLLSLCAFGSLYFPLKVRGVFKKGRKASQWIGMIGLVGMVPLIGIFYSTWFFLLIPVYVAVSIFIFYLSFRYYKDWKYKIVDKVMVEGD